MSFSHHSNISTCYNIPRQKGKVSSRGGSFNPSPPEGSIHFISPQTRAPSDAKKKTWQMGQIIWTYRCLKDAGRGRLAASNSDAHLRLARPPH